MQHKPLALFIRRNGQDDYKINSRTSDTWVAACTSFSPILPLLWNVGRKNGHAERIIFQPRERIKTGHSSVQRLTLVCLALSWCRCIPAVALPTLAFPIGPATLGCLVKPRERRPRAALWLIHRAPLQTPRFNHAWIVRKVAPYARICTNLPKRVPFNW